MKSILVTHRRGILQYNHLIQEVRRCLGLEMAFSLLSSSICTMVFLLALQLAHSQKDINEGNSDIEERLLTLMRADKARRQMPDQRHSDGTADGDGISILDESNGIGKLRKLQIKYNGKEYERINQDCENKTELIMMKTKVGRVCYFHNMENKTYEVLCNGNDTREKIERIYAFGQEIEDKTVLSNIDDASRCLKRPVYKLILLSIKRGRTDENGKRNPRPPHCDCVKEDTKCESYCIREEGWWWGKHCVEHGLRCSDSCRYERCPGS